jgi:diguanylate cyclase (GGDEF)-like protein
MDALQQKSLQKYADNLAQLITRLSAFYEGIDDAIDKELKKLRGHLAGKPDFTLAAVSIQKLNPLLMDGNKHIRHQIKNKVSELQVQVKKIQQLDSASEEIRKSIAQLLTELSLPTSSLNQLFDHLFAAIALFKQNLAEEYDLNENELQTGSVSKNEENELKHQILEELQQWVDVYVKKKPDDEVLAELKIQLMQGLDETQLLESCLILIKTIISETMLDASENGKLVQRIANVLKKTDKRVDEGIALTHKISERNEAQFEHLDEMLVAFDSNVEQQDSVEEVKNKARDYISEIRTQLETNHKSDNQEQEKLMTLLVDMQAQLSKLHQQTQNYKQRLIQQKTSLYTDPLTGVPNRLAYNERVMQAISFAESQNEPLALSVIDVDHFKSINDRYGHAAGDRTLQMIARTLKKALRPNEFLARWGGEEFALLMQNQAASDLQARLDELRMKLSELPFKFKQTPVKITASFGACCYKKGEALQTFFERADNALYAAKQQGRNCVIINE